VLRNHIEECGWRGCIRVVNAGTALIADNLMRSSARRDVFESRFGTGQILGLVADGIDVIAERNTVVGIGPAGDPNNPDTYPMSLGGLSAVFGTQTVFRDNVVRNVGIGIAPVGATSFTAHDNVVEGVNTGIRLDVGAAVQTLAVAENDFNSYVFSIAASAGDPSPVGAIACNWWGSAAGPSAVFGVTAGAYTPFATTPIAGTGRAC
jgi:hypothetical protein